MKSTYCQVRTFIFIGCQQGYAYEDKCHAQHEHYYPECIKHLRQVKSFNQCMTKRKIHLPLQTFMNKNLLDTLESKQILYKQRRKSMQSETLGQSVLHQTETVLHSVSPSVPQQSQITQQYRSQQNVSLSQNNALAQCLHYITQNPAVQRNNRRIEYVNQLWNWYLLLMVSLSMLDLVVTKERWAVLQGSQKLAIKEDMHKSRSNLQ